MGLTNLDIYFNSGNDNQYHLPFTSSNLLVDLSITNSDGDYYQTGLLRLKQLAPIFQINNSILVKINGSSQFDGYLSSRKTTLELGQKIYEYSIVGKTYDLWRYSTDTSVPPSGLTHYLISSIVHDYCEDTVMCELTRGDSAKWSGSFIQENLSNRKVGDVISTLCNYEGYKFYVDNNGVLRIYNPVASVIKFGVSSQDVLQLDGLEESDEDISNVVTVIGGQGYSSINSQLDYPYSGTLYSGAIIAQKFIAEDSVLSAVQLYLCRTGGDNKPDSLQVAIYDTADNVLIDDECDDLDDILLYSSYEHMQEFNTTISELGEEWDYFHIQPSSTGVTISPSFSSTPASAYMLAGTRSYFLSNITDSQYDYGYWRLMYVYAIVYTYGRQGHTLWCSVARASGMAASIATDTPAHYYPDERYPFEASTSCVCDNNSGYKYVKFDFSDQLVLVSGSSAHGRKSFVFYWDDKSDIRIEWGDCGSNYASHMPFWKTTSVSDWASPPTWNLKYSLECMSYYYRFYPTGTITSKTFTAKTQYLLVSSTRSHPASVSSSVKISGSNDAGATWDKITDGVEYDFGDEGEYCTVKFFISAGSTQPATYSVTRNLYTPLLDRIYIRVRDTGGGGNEPNTVLEWSDDISLSPNDVPYPPDWCGWKTYSFPKLALNIGSTYWLAISCNTANETQNWNYYYNSGVSRVVRWKLTGSTTGWSGSIDYPQQHVVPSGSLTYKLGFRDDVVEYTATDESSIGTYGRHEMTITDGNLTDYSSAKLKAESSLVIEPPIKGVITLHGRVDLDIDYRFNLYLEQMDINETLEIVSYTQNINNETGFTSTIEFGEHPYDPVKKISELEGEVFG